MLGAVAVTAVLIAMLIILTGLGARHRGYGLSLALVSGVCFPATWVVWYIRDERPWAVRRRVAAGGSERRTG